ncbi:hypothetical protein [Nonomuraea sp. NPDC052265]|uniref:hypothetical protein n=1 Tax=Nonomuraea sp. NPDC052265 TaxID=3364374 RepID=UPI0037CC3724
MGIKIIEIRLCDYCEKEESKEVEATDEVTINGKKALTCDRHGKPLRKMLEEFNKVSEPVQEPQVSRASRGRRGRTTALQAAAEPRIEPTPSDIRGWALAENERLGEQRYIVRGNHKIRNEVRDAYMAAHGLS